MSHYRLVVAAAWLTASVFGPIELPSVAGAPAGSLASPHEARIDARGAAARIEDAQRRIAAVDLTATRLAVEDMMRTYGDKYPNGRETLAKLVLFERRWNEIAEGASRGELMGNSFLRMASRLESVITPLLSLANNAEADVIDPLIRLVTEAETRRGALRLVASGCAAHHLPSGRRRLVAPVRRVMAAC